MNAAVWVVLGIAAYLVAVTFVALIVVGGTIKPTPPPELDGDWIEPEYENGWGPAPGFYDVDGHRVETGDSWVVPEEWAPKDADE